eukprot:CAMPEP_0203899748 /NCGR_PEP_ID=MMETSP0359-20131031/42119_1 /ASSEMBLY_ACC=CAM_ASM_000338 /TAXON_ID=268821 /ORGANISM="Scrippsiella Hangoei, Strain SHTV-5" /LENGTH=71 /DNA_ID=CAMNT_0050823061 /DNA_START=195 /DNA_END=410 /DNA_ORIENTATION=-
MSMPSGTTWAAIELQKHEKHYTAQSDVKDFFYYLGINEQLGRYFSLPPIRIECARKCDPHAQGRGTMSWPF